MLAAGPLLRPPLETAIVPKTSAILARQREATARDFVSQATKVNINRRKIF